MFFKIGILWKFRNIHSKTPVLKSLPNKVTNLQSCKFIKKRLQHSYYLVNIAKFLETAFFYPPKTLTNEGDAHFSEFDFTSQ